MPYCVDCGAGITPNAAYCTNCGVRVSGMPQQRMHASSSPEQLPRFSTTKRLDLGKIFSASGRIGRADCWIIGIGALASLYGVQLYVDLVGAMDLDSEGIANAIAIIAGLLLWIAYLGFLLVAAILTSIKRLHDLGWPEWLVALVLLPVANLALFLLLLFVPGDQGINKNGEPHSGSAFPAFHR